MALSSDELSGIVEKYPPIVFDWLMSLFDWN